MQRSSGPNPIWAHSTPTPMPPDAAARITEGPIGEYVGVIGPAIASRVANGAWRQSFNIAGWQTDPSILLRPSQKAMPAAFPRSANG